MHCGRFFASRQVCRGCFSQAHGIVAIAVAVCGIIAVASCDSRHSSRSPFRESRYPMRSLLANHSINAIAVSESRYHRDRSQRIAVSTRSLSASRDFIAIACLRIAVSMRSLLANRGFHRDRISRIAASSRSLSRFAASKRSLSRIAKDSSRSLSANRGIIAIALGELRHPCDRSRESPGIHRDRS